MELAVDTIVLKSLSRVSPYVLSKGPGRECLRFFLCVIDEQ